MPLTKKEQAQLEALQNKAKEPEAPAVGRSAVFNVDLGDPDQVKRAMALGLIPGEDDDDGDEGNDDDDDDADADDAPRRGGYFKE